MFTKSTVSSYNFLVYTGISKRPRLTGEKVQSPRPKRIMEAHIPLVAKLVWSNLSKLVGFVLC